MQAGHLQTSPRRPAGFNNMECQALLLWLYLYLYITWPVFKLQIACEPAGTAFLAASPCLICLRLWQWLPSPNAPILYSSWFSQMGLLLPFLLVCCFYLADSLFVLLVVLFKEDFSITKYIYIYMFTSAKSQEDCLFVCKRHLTRIVIRNLKTNRWL